jgi:hypothetical protein
MPSWLQSTYGSTWTRNDTQWWHECMDGISKPLSAQFSWCLVEECTVKMKMHGELVKLWYVWASNVFAKCVSLWSFSLLHTACYLLEELQECLNRWLLERWEWLLPQGLVKQFICMWTLPWLWCNLHCSCIAGHVVGIKSTMDLVVAIHLST